MFILYTASGWVARAKTAGLADATPLLQAVVRCAERFRLIVPLDAGPVLVVRLETGDDTEDHGLVRF